MHLNLHCKQFGCLDYVQHDASTVPLGYDHPVGGLVLRTGTGQTNLNRFICLLSFMLRLIKHVLMRKSLDGPKIDFNIGYPTFFFQNKDGLSFPTGGVFDKHIR